MLSLLRELIRLLSPSQKRRLLVLQILIILMAFAEIVGIASIAPFMAVVANIQLLEQNSVLAQLYAYSGIESAYWFIFWLGVFVLFALGISTCISVITIWRTSLFAYDVGAELSDRLYKYYMHQSWIFHLSHTSAQLTKQITTETLRVTSFVLLPLAQLNARLVLILCMSTALIIYNPMVAIAGLVIFTLSYWCIYKLIKKRLYRNGKRLSDANQQRFRLLNDGIGGIKDTLLLHRQKSFTDAFLIHNHLAARSQAITSVLSNAPKYILELVAFGSAILLVLFLVQSNSQNLSIVIPILSVYALAGFKLLPAFQQTYYAFATIKGNISAFEAIQTDLHHSKKSLSTSRLQSAQKLVPNRQIVFDDVSFCYPLQSQRALDKVHLRLKANQTIGIVGASGSGKSTLIDVLLGLITPQQGRLMIDDMPIDDTNRRAWQNAIGFVSQSIFLSEGTIAENIAFGLSDDAINIAQVQRALQLAHLDSFVATLPQGIATQVGERGVKLSGGQKQRIGIARALYQNAKVLIFDEATSALDGITEKLVMDALHDFGGKKTIVLVAHRLKTVQKCDVIFLMDKGKIIASGNFQSLQKSNAQFATMAQYA